MIFDVVIIGSGMAGISLASELSQERSVCILEKEKAFQLEEIKKSGKDQVIQKKMFTGKMNKYFNEVVLLDQNFVMDDNIKISQFIEKNSKELNASIEIKKIIRFKVAEEI